MVPLMGLNKENKKLTSIDEYYSHIERNEKTHETDRRSDE